MQGLARNAAPQLDPASMDHRNKIQDGHAVCFLGVAGEFSQRGPNDGILRDGEVPSRGQLSIQSERDDRIKRSSDVPKTYYPWMLCNAAVISSGFCP